MFVNNDKKYLSCMSFLMIKNIEIKWERNFNCLLGSG